MIREFSDIATRHFDLMDESTLNCLTTINESDQFKTMDGLITKLYELIQKDALNIDFGSIPDSRGVITKVAGYEDMIQCTGIIKNLLVEYRQDTAPINAILEAISNIQEREDIWIKAYQMKTDILILLYQSTVLNIYTSVSLLIDGCIEYIKDASTESYEIKLDKAAYAKKKDGLMFRTLKDFNNACKSGDVDKTAQYACTAKTNEHKLIGYGGTITLIAIAGVASLINVIIPLLREMIYFFFLMKVRISDACEIQSQLIDMNAEALKNNNYSTMSAKDKAEAVKKQKKIADTFRRLGQKFTVQAASSERKTKDRISAEAKKYTVDDVVRDKLDSYNPDSSSLF